MASFLSRLFGKPPQAIPLAAPLTMEQVLELEPDGSIPQHRKARLGGLGEPPNVSHVTDTERMQAAVRTAEQGDTTKLFALYRDYTANYSHIGAELGKRIMSVISEPHSILPADKTILADRVAVDAVRKMIDNCDDWHRDLGHLLQSCLYPVAVSEKLYEPDTSGGAVKLQWRLKKLSPVNMQLLCFRLAYLSSSATIQSRNPNGDLRSVVAYNPDEWEPDLRFWNVNLNGMASYTWDTIIAPDPMRHIIHRGNYMTDARDNFGGPMRGVLFWAFLASAGRQWFSTFMEFFGQPLPVAKVDTENQDSINFLRTAFRQAQKLRLLVINKEANLDFKEVSTQNSAEAYKSFIDLCNDEISKVIVGQVLSSGAKAQGLGSGASNLQGQVRDDIRKFDQLALGATLRQQLFKSFLQINNFSGNAPRIIWGGSTPDAAKTMAEVVKTMADAGVEPTEEALQELSQRMGISWQVAAKAVGITPPAE